MTVDVEAVARLAGLLADRTRMTLLLALLDGRAWTMGELARQAGVGASTASEQLSRLVAAGLLIEERQGRHRYLRLADRQVARMIEELAGHATAPTASAPASATTAGTAGSAATGGPAATGLRTVRVAQALAQGRTCYDHLAGRLGVTITDALVRRGQIELTDGLHLTPAGATWLSDLSVDVDQLRAARRPLLRTCLDWTERRPHLAGAVGAAIRETFLARGWVESGRTPRVVVVTELGQQTLPGLLGLDPGAFAA
jgi:DNA-binding transcriptional ArsR family regulator